jgi:hypothetical protein
MSIIKDLIMSAGVAVGSLASRERDRDSLSRHADGRPKPIKERAEDRVRAVATEGTARVAVSQTAHIAAKEVAKRATGETLKKVAGALAKRPALAAGSLLFAVDAARDGVRLARGKIDGQEFAERVGGNAAGMAGAGAGAYVGAIVGGIAVPLVGTVVGSVVGGVVGGIGGDTYGRHRVREVFEGRNPDPDAPNAPEGSDKNKR